MSPPPPYAMDIDATAHSGDCNDSASPSVISEISVPLAGMANPPSAFKNRPSALPVLNDTMNVDEDAETDPARQPVNCPGYIIADAEELSTGSTKALPCIIRYMDLTSLKLDNKIRVEPLTLIREEWNIMIEVFNRRERGISGSAIFTGSPGIGKTCFLYYILILCLIQARPVVFQDTRGNVYLITNEVRPQTKEIRVPGDDILTLIDADGEICKPHDQYILGASNLRILLTSSPRSRVDRRWLRQDARDEWAVYIMSPWTQNEWLVASLFIVERDVTLNRFWKTFKICGSIPRQFLHAVKSREALKTVQVQISSAIRVCGDIEDAIYGVVGDKIVPHRAFVVYPTDKGRLWDGGLVKAISEGAMNSIIKTLDKRSADAAFDLYRSTRASSLAPTFRGNLWERKVHGYLARGARSFIIRSLDGEPEGRLDLLEGLEHSVFGPPQELSGKIADHVEARKSVYLQPISENFASLDSIIYQPNELLICLQITNASSHPIKTKGLKALQSLLSPNNEFLCPLRPTFKKPWIIVFVVPTPMEKSFLRQSITGDASAIWSKKTVQYVLGLDEHAVFHAQFEDERESEDEL
ncbi:hypothetical protein AX15_006639 [Amanita polypyramis BW_CC]|nr:hypothetical protein AX15_006639 [Amanita polypyramis BW_CC]